MSKITLICPHCGGAFETWHNPKPTADIIIELADQPGSVVLIERANEPFGWALPGGFVDYGESCEAAAVREAREETGLEVTLLGQVGAYSDPSRDVRHHTITVAFAASAEGTPQALDDAAHVAVFPLDRLPEPLCFDHAKILEDYRRWRKGQGF